MDQNRTLVVTGATSGVGSAVVTDQLRRGATVIASGRSEERLERLRESAAVDKTSDRLHIVKGDLTTDSDLDHLVDVASSVASDGLAGLLLGAFGHIGEDEGKSLVEIGSDDLDEFVKSSVTLNLRTTRAFVPMLKSADGRVICVIADWGLPQHNVLTSGVSQDGPIGSEAYVAAKYALTGLIASLERQSGVTACGLFPGVIASWQGETDDGEPQFLSLDSSDQEAAEAGYELPTGAIPLSDIAAAVELILTTRATVRTLVLKPARHDYDGT